MVGDFQPISYLMTHRQAVNRLGHIRVFPGFSAACFRPTRRTYLLYIRFELTRQQFPEHHFRGNDRAHRVTS